MKRIIGIIIILMLYTNAMAAEPSAWASKSIIEAQEIGIVYENVKYNYAEPVTRKDFCYFAIKTLEICGAEITEGKTDNPFIDTEDYSVIKLHELGIINGKSNTRFAPYDNITREEAAAILNRMCLYLGIEANGSKHTFKDEAEFSSWATNDIYSIYSLGIMNGVGENIFAPKASYTTEQTVITMVRIYKFPHKNPEKEEKTVGETDYVNTDKIKNIPTNMFLNEEPIPEKTQIEKMVFIPANPDFVFACDLENEKGNGEAAPITDDYYLSKYLTTNAEYKEFLEDTESDDYPKYWKDGTYPTGKGQHPVLWVSYEEAEEYCEWLEDKYDGWDFRLPTEAEYENASVGKGNWAYAWGNSAETAYDGEMLDTKMNYNAVAASFILEHFGNKYVIYNNQKSSQYGEKIKIRDVFSISEKGGVKGWVDHKDYTGFIYTDFFSLISTYGGYTSPVNYFKDGVSKYGLYDMCGNAYSWTSSEIEAVNGAEKGEIVNAVRGGSWYATAASCKATFRGEGRKPSGRYATIGFRVAGVRIG